MSKRKARALRAAQADRSPRGNRLQPTGSGKLGRFPLWVWALIFLVPLILSEYMFYVAGRTVNMVLFPIAWIGFWIAIMIRRGVITLKPRKGR